MDLMGVLLGIFSPRRSAEVAGQVHRTPWCAGRLAGAPLPSQCLQRSQGNSHTDVHWRRKQAKCANATSSISLLSSNKVLTTASVLRQPRPDTYGPAVMLAFHEHLPQMIKPPCCSARLPCLPLVRATQCQPGGHP